MPRPMRQYQSGIRTVTVSRWLTCPVDGVESFRSRTFTGPLADDDAKAWTPDPHCSRCIRERARKTVGL